MSDGQLYRGDRRVPSRPLGALELITLATATAGVLGIWLLQVAVVPRFALMFRDFGGELPLATKIVLQPFVAGVATLVVIALALSGAATRATTQRLAGAVLLVLSAVLPMITLGMMTLALYLPIVSLASEVR